MLNRPAQTLVNFADEYIYSIGRRSVLVYSIEYDDWTGCAPLKKDRFGSSGCALGDFVYVCGGYGQGSIAHGIPFQNSIERFNATHASKELHYYPNVLQVHKPPQPEQHAYWELIELADSHKFLAREAAFVAPISSHEIAIFGGCLPFWGFQGDGWVFDARY